MPSAQSLACIASTAPGVEGLLVRELGALGIATGDVEPGAVEFAASRADLAMALLQLRTASRVAVRLASFGARTFGELERHAAKVAWDRVVAPGIAVHFRVTSRKSRLYHQDAIAERLERAVEAALPGTHAVRAPSAAEELESEVARLPTVQRILVRALRDEFVLSADAAGALLHMRGWRRAVAKAPLRETLAAALLLAAEWDPGLPLHDPFCGSGTIVIEAALMARRFAPGRGRRFAIENWPDSFADEMRAARAVAASAERPHTTTTTGSDRDAGAIAAAAANAERAGVAGDVSFTVAPLSALAADTGAGWIVTNPPYGARVGERNPLRDLYATLGKVMRERRPGWRLAMLSADRRLEGQLGIPLRQVLATNNGGIPVRVVVGVGR